MLEKLRELSQFMGEEVWKIKALGWLDSFTSVQDLVTPCEPKSSKTPRSILFGKERERRKTRNRIAKANRKRNR